MSSLVLLSVPGKKTEIKRVSQNAVVNMAFGNGLSGFRANHLPQIGKRAIAGSVQLKDALGDLGVFGVNFDVVIYFVVAVPEGCAAWVNALRGLFLHAFFDFLAQVLNVITGNEKLEAMHQFGLRLGILIKDLA